MKECKGFDEFACWCCARCNYDATERLVTKLIVDPDDGFKHCNHHVRYMDQDKAIRNEHLLH